MAAVPHVAPLVALSAWIPIGLFLFYRYPVRIAILTTFIGGWAVLPTANFAPSDDSFPYWILSVCLPAAHFVTKATTTGMTVLAGVLIFDTKALRRFRLSLWDLPMSLWCAVPLLSGLANHAAYAGALRDGLRGALYQFLAWGVPYLMGRLYFDDNASLRLAAKAFVIAGLCYVPICLVEFFTGPQLYAHVYGYQPYRWLGAQRYVGFRPIGFLEDGNQLGIWMATSALLATGLWKQGQSRRVLGLPIGWAAATLLFITLLCQSNGSIILLLCLLPFVLAGSTAFRRRFVAVLAVMILCFAGLRLANVVSLRWIVDHNRAARGVASILTRIGRESFSWRLKQDEEHVRTALTKPFLGSGLWYWWKDGSQRPWGLWLLAFGMFGGVGLLALESLQIAPVVGAVWGAGPREESPNNDPLNSREDANSGLRPALGAVILLAAIDNLLNSGMILPLVLLIGGMSVWRSGRSKIEADAGG